MFKSIIPIPFDLYLEEKERKRELRNYGRKLLRKLLKIAKNENKDGIVELKGIKKVRKDKKAGNGK